MVYFLRDTCFFIKSKLFTEKELEQLEPIIPIADEAVK